MKKYGILLVVLLTTVVLAAPAMAGRDNHGPRHRRDNNGPGRHWDNDGPGRHRGPGRSDCLKRLDLTEDQQAAIDAMQAAIDAIKQRARNAAKDAETPEQRRKIYERAHEAIKGELTEDQLAELEKCRERGRGPGKGPRHGDCLKKLDLTEDQRAELEKCRERGKGRRRGPRQGDCMKKLNLTEDQRAELEECRERGRGRNRPGHRLGCMEELDLTEDQQTAVDRIRERAMNAARDAETREDRRAIFEDMHEAIKGQLTEDQLADLEKCKAGFRERIRAREGSERPCGDHKGEGRRVRRRRGR